MYYSFYSGENQIGKLVGETITDIEGMDVGSGEIIFTCDSGRKFVMAHQQDCCEDVRLIDIAGCGLDLIGKRVNIAYETSSEETPEGMEQPDDSYTWTFYTIGTVKGTVVLRWLGESNGYYSEDVDFWEID